MSRTFALVAALVIDNGIGGGGMARAGISTPAPAAPDGE
jgi:hypothetical protein